MNGVTATDGTKSNESEPVKQQTPAGTPAQLLPVVDSVHDYEKIFRIGEDKAREKSSGDIVALKKVRFDRSRDGVPVTSIRELRVLQSCQHDNIVALRRVVTGAKADSVFLVFEYCEHDLGRLLDWMPKPFSVAEVKCLLLQLLEAVSFLHEQWIMHRDLKMSNLLYTRNGVLKLCDFGLARYFQPGSAPMTPRVVTLWYRAPEVLLGGELYDEAIDMWSVGCIMGELLRHEPLFPAENELGCLKMMCTLLGSPSARIWPGLAQLPGAGKIQFPEQPYNHLKNAFPLLSDAGCALLNALLTYDPLKRITARQAMRHEFFQEKPYPRHSSDMPTFPSSHERPKGVAAPAGAAKRDAAAAAAKVPIVAPKRQALEDRRLSHVFD